MTAIILDTETNDNQNDPEPIEVAWVPHDIQPSTGGGFQGRFRPSRPSTFGALATHGILAEELLDCPPSSTAVQHVPLTDYWIGHNIDFDWRVLGSPPDVKRICTLALARDLWPELDSHKLTAVFYYTHGANQETRERVRAAHGALADVFLCADILKVMMRLMKISTLEALWHASEEARILKVWTFGKFKGQKIEAADRGYANWCRKQPDFDPYVLKALERVGLL